MCDKRGICSSYQSPDSINVIDRRCKTEHAGASIYYKGLIRLRKNHPAFRSGDADLVYRHLEFLSVESSSAVAYHLRENTGGGVWGDIYAILNLRKEIVEVLVPKGRYVVVCKDGSISKQGSGTIYRPEIFVLAQSALILYK